MMETTRLGAMAMQRVIRFLSHFFILMSRNPCTYATGTKQQGLK
jgi:hypothetical protein